MTTTLYKLTNADRRTYGGFRWYPTRRRLVPPEARGRVLCTTGVIHAYRGLELALLLDDAHGRYLAYDIHGPRAGLIWRAETDGGIVADDGAKVGVWDLVLRENIPIPSWLYARTIVTRASGRLALLALGSVLATMDPTTPDGSIASEVYRTGEALMNAWAETHEPPGREIEALRGARRRITYTGGDYFRNGAPRHRFRLAAHSAASTLLECTWNVGTGAGIATDLVGTIETCAEAVESFDAAGLAERAVKETLEREKDVVEP